MSDVNAIVKGYALELGFDLVRVTSAQEFAEDREAALERLQAGLMGGLPWYNEARVLRGTNPQELLPGARSIICLGLNYYCPDGPVAPAIVAAGKVARYAQGWDYHQLMKKRMRGYVEGLRARLGTGFAACWYVDDGPMLDRAAARRTGLGWFGKNGNILTPSHGSWVFLGQVITGLDIEPDQVLKKTCGSCVRCIDACPTGAIVAPYVVDNTRCISYLTIENRGPIPAELRPRMGDWVFGCDVCQDVCPVNRKAFTANSSLRPRQRVPLDPSSKRDQAFSAPPVARGDTPLAAFAEGGQWGDFPKEGLEFLDLVGLLEMSDEQFRCRFQGTPILRAKRVGLQRNACVALGNRRDPEAVPALRRALLDGESLVRGHAAWALGRIGNVEARQALQQARAGEADPEFLQEIAAALAAVRGAVPVAPG